ncbi:MAG: hypothetical protein OXH50_06245 [Gemmatimonadetes bacterium]|nr:hypothetical protein [Gemmatimonadota bacterium]
MKKTASTLVAALAAIAAFALAVSAEEGGQMPAEAEGQMHPPSYVGSPELERMKGLAGSWVVTEGMPGGKGAEGEGEMMVGTEYRVAANGSVVVERNFPGTPKEMISVYHDRGGKLSMTHYCAMGNQPQMTLTGSEEGVLTFEMVEGSIESEEMPHMNSLSIAVDGDEMSQSWTMFDGSGQKTHTMTFRRAR